MLSLRSNLLAGFLVVLFSVPCNAQQLDAQQENRAQKLFLELRCVVCQNQSIADSDAEVARDLRELVREKIAGGSSDRDVKQFLVSRYGEFVLLKPEFAPHTYLLWFSPLLVLLLGLYWMLKARPKVASPVIPLTEDEQAALDKMLSK